MPVCSSYDVTKVIGYTCKPYKVVFLKHAFAKAFQKVVLAVSCYSCHPKAESVERKRVPANINMNRLTDIENLPLSG
jgi:hypothetical protein